VPRGSYIRTPEVRAKQSAAMTGKFPKGQHPMDGVKKSKEHVQKMREAMLGKPSAFKGKKHSEQSKQNMGFGKTGVMRNEEERAAHRKQYKESWREAHPEKIEEYDKRYLKPKAIRNAERRRKLRKDGIIKLGGRCSSKTCGWVNEDGTRGCTDFRVLQFDHVNGGGTQERKKTPYYEGLCKDVLADTTGKFQLLCVNCNWIKAFEKREFIYKYEIGKEDPSC